MVGKQADIKVGVVTSYDDKGIKSAKGALADFKQSVADADGVGGKFKAGWSSVADSVKANAGALAIGAGAALVGFGVKAVGVFSDLGVEVGKFADATGVTAEQASRLIEVAGDVGISADTLESSIGKMNKTAGLTPQVFEDAGVGIVRAKDGAVDANATFLNVVDRLNGIKDPAQKAALATKLLGKGWQSMSELIGQGSDKLKKSLDGVSNAKVFDDDKVAKARKWREATDNLKDTFEDLVITLGSDLAPTLEKIAGLAEKAGKAFGWLGDHDPISGFTGLVDDLWDSAISGSTDAEKAAHRYEEAQAALALRTSETHRETEKLVTSMGHLIDHEQEAEDAARKYADQVDKASRDVQTDIDAMQAKWDELRGTLDRDKSWLNIQQQVADVRIAIEEAGAIALEKGPGSPEAIAATQDAQLKTIDLKNAVIDYGEKILGLPPEKVTALLVDLDQGNFDATLADMDRQLLNHTFRINAHIDNITVDGETHVAGTAKGITPKNVGGEVKQFAKGGTVPGPKNAPMLAVVHGGEEITPTSEVGKAAGGSGGNTYNVEIKVQSMPTPADVMRLVKVWEARNGPGWRS